MLHMHAAITVLWHFAQGKALLGKGADSEKLKNMMCSEEDNRFGEVSAVAAFIISTNEGTLTKTHSPRINIVPTITLN